MFVLIVARMLRFGLGEYSGAVAVACAIFYELHCAMGREGMCLDLQWVGFCPSRLLCYSRLFLYSTHVHGGWYQKFGMVGNSAHRGIIGSLFRGGDRMSCVDVPCLSTRSGL